MMVERDLEVARSMADAILTMEGARVHSIHFFGSRTCGHAGPDSDYDLLVVLRDFVEIREDDDLRYPAHMEVADRLTNELMEQFSELPDVKVCSDEWFIDRGNPYNLGEGSRTRSKEIVLFHS